jgi:hypothetical protein
MTASNSQTCNGALKNECRGNVGIWWKEMAALEERGGGETVERQGISVGVCGSTVLVDHARKIAGMIW